MMISGIRPKQLNEMVSFHWAKQGFRYLGIIITPETTRLFEANYNKRINQIRSDLVRWEVLPLSLFNRVETVRMNLLPRFLFLFQSLPIRVPISTFNTLNKLISQFELWDELWDKLCYRCYKGINSQQWKEFDWKIKIRYFHTPLVISNLVKDPSASLCWRQCGETGDHTHILWDCPVILAYWKNIKEEMEKIVKREVPSNVRFFLLGIISVDVFNADQRYILRVLLLIAKKNITVKWKSVKPPTVTEWKQRLKQIYMMEKIIITIEN